MVYNNLPSPVIQVWMSWFTIERKYERKRGGLFFKRSFFMDPPQNKVIKVKVL